MDHGVDFQQVEAFVPIRLSALTRLPFSSFQAPLSVSAPVPVPVNVPVRVSVKSPSASIRLHASSKKRNEDYPNRYFDDWQKRRMDEEDEDEDNIRIDSMAAPDAANIHSPQGSDDKDIQEPSLEPVKLQINDPAVHGCWDQDFLLFRHVSNPPAEQLVSSFVSTANADTVQAMTGTATSLVGGFSNPSSGIEVSIRGDKEQLLGLNHQFLMTGYLYRNVEYVLAIREILGLKASATLEDYQAAFENIAGHPRLGFLTYKTVQKFFDRVYMKPAPPLEAQIFFNFFDQDEDGYVSWDDFQLTIAGPNPPRRDHNQKRFKAIMEEHQASATTHDSSKEEVASAVDLKVSGNVEFKTPEGRVWKEDVNVYVEMLREESRKLKMALAEYEEGEEEEEEYLDVAKYVASRNEDLGPLISQISQDVSKAIAHLGEHVLDKTYENAGWKKPPHGFLPDTLDIPGNVMQQSVLWQLVMGYKLREMEATGDYMRLRAAPRDRFLPFT